jgi:hypothetical protein
MMKDPVRKDRQLSGFYRCGKVQPLRRASLLQIGPNFTLRWKTTLVPTEDEEPLIIRRIKGRLISATEKHHLAGYLDWYLFEAAPFKVVRRLSFLDACDAHSQELYDLAEQLRHNRRFSIERLLAMGPVAFMNLLEIRPPFAGQGLAVQATRALAAQLHNDIGLHVAFMVPVPLQYQPASDNDDTAEIDQLSFRRDRAKLIRYYKRVFGLSEVKRGDGYWAWNIDDGIDNYGNLPG